MAWVDGSEKQFHTKWECVGVKEKNSQFWELGLIGNLKCSKEIFLFKLHDL
jgi:hypothetical protein